MLLVAMGPADAAHRDELLDRAQRLGAGLAFLQVADPSLGRELTRLADAGTPRVVLVGTTAGASGPGVSWLRRIADQWWRDHGPGAPEVATASRLLVDDADWPALVRSARPVTGVSAGLTSPAWEDVPAHARQMLVCRGPRCTAAGAEESWRSLTLALMAHGLGDDDVLVTTTGCQFPCNQAPVASIQPDDVWYGRVDPETARLIVGSHLVDGEPHSPARLPRRVG